MEKSEREAVQSDRKESTVATGAPDRDRIGPNLKASGSGVRAETEAFSNETWGAREMENVGQAADTVGDLIVQSNRDLPTLRRMVDHLEQLNNMARSYQDAYPEGGAREWADMVQEVENARATITGLREQVAQDREALTRGRDEAAKMLQWTGGGDVTTDLAWPNTPADEVVARQQVALLAALRDRDEARAYLRERGDDVLQLRVELNESVTAQQQLAVQVDRQNVEIRRLLSLVQSERALRQTAETLKDVMVADGRRQDVEIQNLRSQLQGVQRDLRLKTIQSDERMHSLEALKKKLQDLRGGIGQPASTKVAEELQESERQRQTQAEEITVLTAQVVKLKRMLASVRSELADRVREVAESAEGASESSRKLAKWQALFEEVTAMRDEAVRKIEELRDRLVVALRNGVLDDEGLRGAVDFLNWSRDNFLVVGDLVGWIEAWQTLAPFPGTVNVIGAGPATTSSSQVPLPAIADVTQVDDEVTKWRTFVEDLLHRLHSRTARDPDLVAALEPDAVVEGETSAEVGAQTSFLSPSSKPSAASSGAADPSVTFTADDFRLTSATDAIGSHGVNRPSASASSKSKRSCKGTHLAAMKSARAAPTGPVRHKEVTPAIVEAYEAMVLTKPWERYYHLPSIFPEERATAATRMVDEALKAFWLKRGREVFERLFYLKLDSAGDKYGSLDQIIGPLEMVLARLKIADEECAGQQHLSPIDYFCSPRHHWPILFRVPICLKTMFVAHGGDAQAERVVLSYLAESQQWFPKVPALVRQQEKWLDWSCDPATTFRYYSHRGALKSKLQGDLAKYRIQSMDDLKGVCAQAIGLVDSNTVVPDQPYDFVDLAFSGMHSPGPQWGAFDDLTQGRWVRVDGGPVEPRDTYEERLALASGATII